MGKKGGNDREYVYSRDKVWRKPKLTVEHLAKFFLLLKPAPRQHGASNYSAAKWGVKSIFRRLKEKALPSKQFGSNVANSVAVTKGSGCIISILRNGDGLERQVHFLVSLHKWKIPQHVTPAQHHSLQGVLCFPTLHKCDMDSLGEVISTGTALWTGISWSTL